MSKAQGDVLGVSLPIWAVLPIKRLDAAKQRLAKRYSASFRRQLMQAMAADVLNALSLSQRLAGVLVVTNDAEARALAIGWGAEVTSRGAELGHTGAVMAGASVLSERGVAGVFALPGDAPGVTAEEIDSVLARHGSAPAVTIVPSHDWGGTNGVVMTPPDAMALSFGDGSFDIHLAAARTLGIEPAIVALEGLGLDIDQPEDVMRLIEKRWNTRASRLLAENPETFPDHASRGLGAAL